MAKRCIRFCLEERGQALAELALILPALALLIFASLTIGLVIMADFNLRSAAREAARVGAEVGTQRSPYSKATQWAEAKAKAVLEDRGLDTRYLSPPDFSSNDSDYPRDGIFCIELTYDYPLPLIDFSSLPLPLDLGAGGFFTLQAKGCNYIQKHKSRWP
jgi:hypothetical protein